MLKAYETERLTLKPLSSDAAPMVLNFYEENKEAFEPWEPQRGNLFYTQPYHKASLTAEFNQMTEGKLIRYWVFLKGHTQEIIGSLCFHNILKDPYQSCYLGYKFASKYHRQGYAMESITKGIEIMFNEYQLHRIEAHIMADNEASLHLIEKLGFRFEGISYSYAKISGEWKDHKRYSLIQH